MIFSISPRCASEKLCARAGAAGSISRAAAAAAASRRRFGVIAWFLCEGMSVKVWTGSLGGSRVRRLVARDVVGPDPAGGADRETRLGAGREHARGFPVAAGERRLGGGEVRLGEVAFAAVRHGEIIVAVGDVGIARHSGTQVV